MYCFTQFLLTPESGSIQQVYIVACQRHEVSNKPLGQRQDTGGPDLQGSLDNHLDKKF